MSSCSKSVNSNLSPNLEGTHFNPFHIVRSIEDLGVSISRSKCTWKHREKTRHSGMSLDHRRLTDGELRFVRRRERVLKRWQSIRNMEYRIIFLAQGLVSGFLVGVLIIQQSLQRNSLIREPLRKKILESMRGRLRKISM